MVAVKVTEKDREKDGMPDANRHRPPVASIVIAGQRFVVQNCDGSML